MITDINMSDNNADKPDNYSTKNVNCYREICGVDV